MHRYTEEEHKFLREFIPGHTCSEIAKAFTEKFRVIRTLSDIKAYMGNYKLKNGIDSRFKKGHVSPNKGKKGFYQGSEKGWFKKGNTPANHRPVGSERVSKDGYIEIKTAEPNKWRLKHRVIWEEANGPIKKNECLIFRDNNKTNCSLDNLILISRATLVIMNKDSLYHLTGEEKDVAVNLARLKTAINSRKE